MKARVIVILAAIGLMYPMGIHAQVEQAAPLKLGGDLQTDQRFLLESPNDWAWNETRLTLQLDKSISDHSRFHAELWARNIGLPAAADVPSLSDKGLADPFDMEMREAWVEVYGLFSDKLDMRIGRQYIAWGTADKLNPTDNLCPYDMEDILDFGRHRATNALSLTYYLSDDFSAQGVFIPFFRPANLPIGIFSDVLSPEFELPPGMMLKQYSDTVLMPAFDLRHSSSAGVRLKGFIKGVDLSLSYVWGIDGLPFSTLNTVFPFDTQGGLRIVSQLGYARSHIFGADLATNIGGAGVWAEAALFLPDEDVTMTTDISALFPPSPVPVTIDSVLLSADDPYLKFIVGGDYFFAGGGYLNVQYMHGFFHERGAVNLNDYLFLQYEQKLFRERLTVMPLSGAVIVSDWEDVPDNYSLVYMPGIAYQATPNTELRISAVIFQGEGESLFSSLNDFDMFICKLKYSF